MTEPTLAVVFEPDATPMVRLLTQTIRASLRQRSDLASVPWADGSVVIKSGADAQVATLQLSVDGIRIVSGADPDATTVLTVDLARRLEVTQTSPDGNPEMAAIISSLLKPSLPSWDEAARQFWRDTSAEPGMPNSLVVHHVGNAGDDDDVLELGAGLPSYVVRGNADALSGLFTGADSFLDEVYAGNLTVRGTLPQLSVMAGASFKVRFRV